MKDDLDHELDLFPPAPKTLTARAVTRGAPGERNSNFHNEREIARLRTLLADGILRQEGVLKTTTTEVFGDYFVEHRISVVVLSPDEYADVLQHAYKRGVHHGQRYLGGFGP